MDSKIEIKPETLIKAKGFHISIGKRADQIALISNFTGDFASFNNIKKGGKLSKIKRKFRRNLSSTNHFFFEGMNENDVKDLLKILNK
jgi:hypothetical protein